MTLETKDIIELIAIVVAAIFGILGYFSKSESKSKHGKIAFFIAIAGILSTCGFSLYTTYKKQQSDHRDTVVKDSLLKDQNNKYRDEIKFQDSILTKADNSLDKEKVIQTQTSQLITGLESSVKTQNRILGEQYTANKNISRSLNQLIPFGINYIIRTQLDPSGKITTYTDHRLKQAQDNLFIIIKKYDSLKGYDFSQHTGLVKRNDINGDIIYTVTPQYAKYPDFAFLNDSETLIGLVSDDEAVKNPPDDKFFNPFLKSQQNPEFTARAFFKFRPSPTEHMYIKNGNYFGIDVGFMPTQKGKVVNTFILNFSTIDITIDINHNYKSTDDLKNTRLILQMNGIPGMQRLETVTLSFPPYYAYDYIVNLEDKGNQLQNIAHALVSINKLQ